MKIDFGIISCGSGSWPSLIIWATRRPANLCCTAHARALGYPSTFELQNAMRNGVKGNNDYNERSALAITRLLEKFGASPNDEWPAVAEAFDRMADGFSGTYMESLCNLAREMGVQPSTDLPPDDQGRDTRRVG